MRNWSSSTKRSTSIRRGTASSSLAGTRWASGNSPEVKHMHKRLAALAALALLSTSMLLTGAERKAVAPPAVVPVGPYSPGILTDDFLYVSGQGAKNAEGQIPP